MGRVEGKVALVTGAARGLGRAIAVLLAQEGADLLLLDVAGALPTDVKYAGATTEDLAETAALVEKAGRRAVTAQVDVRDLDAMRAAIDDGVEQLGRLDVVVANAAICIIAPWDEVTPEIVRDTFDTNITGVWNTFSCGARHLVAGGGGSMVVVSSAAGLRVQPYMIPYATSKWAVRGMAKGFAAELAQHHVRVNSVHPTGMATGITGPALQEQFGAAIAANPRPAQMLVNMQPVEIAQPEEVAPTVLFLASDESALMTGHELAPDAGISAF